MQLKLAARITLISLLLSAVSAAPALTSDQAVDQLRQQSLQLFGIVEGADDDEQQQPEAELGRALFWDMRLSADGKTACASCHFRENWGSDSRQFSVDARGQMTLQSQIVFQRCDSRWRNVTALRPICRLLGPYWFA